MPRPRASRRLIDASVCEVQRPNIGLVGDTGEDAARRLETEVAALLGWIGQVDKRTVGQRPGADDWSAVECLAHTAEFIPFWAAWATDVAARERTGEPFGRTHDDIERLAAVERGRGEPIDALIARVRSGTERAAATFRAIPDERWARSGRHARRGEMTIREFVDAFVINHVREHAQQARAAIA